MTATQAQAELGEIARHTEKVRPQSNIDVTARVRSLHQTVVWQVRDAAFMLLTAVSVVLLIACANVANLLLARATSAPSRDECSRRARRLAIPHRATTAH